MALFLVLHVVFCITVYIFMRIRLLVGTRMIFPLVCFVPVWGALALLVLELHSRRQNVKAADPDVDRLRVENEIYQNIPVDSSIGQSQVAPINEILTLNDSKVRRNVIMEVLYDDPADYIQQLQVARKNDDTEVVHYAVTALVELQKDYDLKFRRMENKMLEAPEDPVVQKEYLGLLEHYVDSGLIEDSSRAVYVQNYSEMLQKELDLEENYHVYLKKIKADMELKDYSNVYRCASRMVQLWPNRETGYLKLIEYYAHQKDRSGIDRVLAALKDRGVYLSPGGRGTIRFWQKNTEGSM